MGSANDWTGCRKLAIKKKGVKRNVSTVLKCIERYWKRDIYNLFWMLQMNRIKNNN